MITMAVAEPRKHHNVGIDGVDDVDQLSRQLVHVGLQ
jgi:hypothetical protein